MLIKKSMKFEKILPRTKQQKQEDQELAKQRVGVREVRKWEGALTKALQNGDMETLDMIGSALSNEEVWRKDIFAYASPALQREILTQIGHAYLINVSKEKDGVWSGGAIHNLSRMFGLDNIKREGGAVSDQVKEYISTMFHAGDFDMAYAVMYGITNYDQNEEEYLFFSYADASQETKKNIIRYVVDGSKTQNEYRRGYYYIEDVQSNFSVPAYNDSNADMLLRERIDAVFRESLYVGDVKTFSTLAQRFKIPDAVQKSLVPQFADMDNEAQKNLITMVAEKAFGGVRGPGIGEIQITRINWEKEVASLFQIPKYNDFHKDIQKSVLDTICSAKIPRVAQDVKEVFSVPSYEEGDAYLQDAVCEAVAERANAIDMEGADMLENDIFHIPGNAVREKIPLIFAHTLNLALTHRKRSRTNSSRM